MKSSLELQLMGQLLWFEVIWYQRNCQFLKSYPPFLMSELPHHTNYSIGTSTSLFFSIFRIAEPVCRLKFISINCDAYIDCICRLYGSQARLTCEILTCIQNSHNARAHCLWTCLLNLVDKIEFAFRVLHMRTKQIYSCSQDYRIIIYGSHINDFSKHFDLLPNLHRRLSF